MSTPIVCRESKRTPLLQCLRSAGKRFLAPVLGMLFATMACAQTIATFTLQDKTNLPAGTYQIYVTGFSTAGPTVPSSCSRTDRGGADPARIAGHDRDRHTRPAIAM